MKRDAGGLWGLVVVLSVSVAAIPAAFAYIDPGTGSYIFQAVVGALLAVALAIKVFWRRIWGFVTGRSRRDAKAGRQPVESQAQTQAHARAQADAPQPADRE